MSELAYTLHQIRELEQTIREFREQLETLKSLGNLLAETSKRHRGERDELREPGQRWNRAASKYAAGSEFIDDPELVFAQIERSLEFRVQLATKRERELSDQLAAALNELMVSSGGGDKKCGHQYTCCCAWDGCRAALAQHAAARKP